MDTTTRQLATPDTIDVNAVERYGGKAVNLAELSRMGLRVPEWFAIPADVLESALATSDLAQTISGHLEGMSAKSNNLSEKCSQIREWIRALDAPAGFVERLEETYTELIGTPTCAVRSSARQEDTEDLSFAGLHDSYLFVERSELWNAVRRVWASAFNDRAIRYRLDHGSPTSDLGVAVLVQKMVEPEASGVMFTANPTNEDVEEILINSLYGAGEGLVSEGLPADTFTVDKMDGQIKTDVAVKETKFERSATENSGLIETAVDQSKRKVPSLGEETIRRLAETASKLEDRFETAQDVEFTVGRDGLLYFLQTRPVTTVKRNGPANGKRTIWDNSNIIESYSGVTTPLTFSFIEEAYTIVYKCFSEVMGIPDETVRQNMPVFENMLGLIRGEVYYNLLNWYRLIRMFPGFRFNREFMESMMGVDESLEVGDKELDASFFDKFADLSALVRLLTRSSYNFARIRKIAEDFESHFNRHFEQWEQYDFDEMSSFQLMELYWEMKQKLLWNWKAPIINDFFVMIFYGLLEKLCDEWVGDKGGTLQHDLICGEGGIETKEASNALIRLAAMANDDAELRELIVNRPLDDISACIRNRAEFTDFVDAVDSYLAKYGARAMNELKLEEPTLRDRPAFLFQMIRNYLTAEDSEALDLEARRTRELKIRRDAEQRAFSALSFPKRFIFRKILDCARLGVKNRENMRFARTRIYGMVRELFMAVENNFRQRGILADKNDIFYLTVDEIWGYVKGTAVTTDLQSLVDLRREEFETYRNNPDQSPSDRFITYGPVYDDNDFRRRPVDQTEENESGFSGTGCCSGVVEGPVKVIRSPHDDMSLNGEILVAERTDPGWVPLYPSASGVVIERGSVLSHSAIVAREMGLPTVVGVDGITDALESGRKIEIDGRSGTVRLLDQ